MTTGLLVFSNLIVPLIAGLFFLLYFAYFVIAHPSNVPSYRFFVIFLIGFSIFLFGRPLQLILGPHPLPLIIVNIRVFILCSVISPAIILAAGASNRQKVRHGELVIVLICLLLGLTYDVFNTLGTRASYDLFEVAGLTARDNLTPSAQAPFFGREVTIAVQFITGSLLLLFSLLKLVRLRPDVSLHEVLRNKDVLINAGIIVFALSFIVGSLAKQWWIYYATSIVTALLFGGSVIIDAKQVHHYYERLVPFIKEDIINNVAFSEFSKIKLIEMLNCLGKRTNLDTFMVIKITEKKLELSYDLDLVDSILSVINRRLSLVLSSECFLLLPLSNTRIGVALRLADAQIGGGSVPILEVLEDLQQEISDHFNCALSVGIGRSYDRIEELRISYHEALTAQEYADQLAGSRIIHVENINEAGSHTNRYPVKEKERLLSLIKLGDIENARSALADFMGRFRAFIEEKPDVLRARLYELVGSLTDTAILAGGDEDALNELIVKYVGDVGHIRGFETAEKWLSTVVEEVAASVVHVYERRSKVLVEKAKGYIEEHYSRQLSYKDVAKAVFISPSYFLYLFKQETGTTFVDYLTSVRLERAKSLLVSSEMTITEIAFEVGFNSSNYFSGLFHRTVGVSASEYRARRVDPAFRPSFDARA